MRKILIVGGVAGGATAAARIRRLDEHAEIIMFERGEHISFANCGLPYYIGGTIAEREDLLLQTPKSFHMRFNVDVRISSEVLSIERDTKTVTILNCATGEKYSENYDTLILAPGGEPIKPPLEGIDSDRVFTLRNVADTDKIKNYIACHHPKKAVVIGGGFIGIEMAENLVEAGMEDVSVVELAEQVIAPIDADMACDVQHYMRRMGVKLLLNSGLRRIIDNSDMQHTNDKSQLIVELFNSASTITNNTVANSAVLSADIVVLAIGVKPESKLALDAGLEVNSRGGIVVDEYMRTSDLNIYAVGDAVETTDFVTGQATMLPLAGPANRQARIAADNICGIKSKYAGSQGSAVIKIFDMTVAFTGINEKTAKRMNLDYDKEFLWLPGHAGYYPGARPMSIKVIYDKKDGRILGAQFVGYDGVDKRRDVLAVAIRAKMTAYDLTRLELCYAPPYSSAKDPVNMAGFAIENALNGIVKKIHWHDVDGLPRDGSANLIDVRNPQETARGRIDGFINIPLDTLRGRLRELDKSKPVYVHCQSGMRSYIAARILTQNGFDVFNISGGYRLYSSVKS